MRVFTLAVSLVLTPWLWAQDVVRVQDLIPTLKLDIRYATTNNFTHQRVYDVADCYLRPATAKKLAEVQADLKRQGLGLMVYDCYRPLSVQKKFWAIVPDERYVANPAQGSRHNRGAAVDLTLVDKKGRALEMPTEFDDFSERAHRDYLGLSKRQKKNRKSLEDAMQRHGFMGLPTEWWHFDDADWKQYPVMDAPVGTK